MPTADPYVHLEKCTYFDQARVDQRFEVVNEIAASICSKYDKSKSYRLHFVSPTFLFAQLLNVLRSFPLLFMSHVCTSKEKRNWYQVNLLERTN